MLLSCRGVLFDCDGVLVDSTASGERAWTRWAHEHGLDPAAVLRGVHGRRSAETVRLHLPPERHEAALRRVEVLEIDDAASTSAIPGARRLLAALPANWAIVTSASRPLLLARLAAAGLAGLEAGGPVTVTGDDVSRGKPDPEGYRAAAAALGLPTDACVIVEDSANGVAAARAAGPAHVLGVGVGALDTPADPVVRDLRGIRWSGAGLLLPGVLRRSSAAPRGPRTAP